MMRTRLYAAGLLALAVVVAGCSGGSGKQASPTTVASTGQRTSTTLARSETSTSLAQTPLQHFGGHTEFALAFDHPRAWHETRYVVSSSFSDLIVFLSNARLHNPCFSNDAIGKGAITCGEPIKTLSSGDVLVSWQNVGFPHVGPEIPHPNATISGEPADVTVARPGECGRIGGQETISADIARPHGNQYDMMACMRGPNLAENEALVHQMLRSVHVSG